MSNRKHGLSSSPIYRVWCSMFSRCYRPKCKEYKLYGARGITVCERWKDIECFVADVNYPPSPKHSLERINNDGNYEPGNVRWATIYEQTRNRRSNVWITLNGRTMIATDWAKERHLNPTHVCSRLRSGWTPEEALNPQRRLRADASERTRRSQGSLVGITTIESRMRRGWTFEQASTILPQKGRKPSLI